MAIAETIGIKAKTDTVEDILGTVRGAAETAHEFKTIADKFIDDWGLGAKKQSPGSVSTPGRPPNPMVYDYPSQWSKQSLDQSIKDIRSSLSNVGTQIKGLFNLAYESPTGGQTAAAMSGGPSSTGGAGIAGLTPLAVIVWGSVIALVLYLWRKR